MGKVKTKVVSSAVPEDIEKWVKYRSKIEGVSPSHWLATLLTYNAMVDLMTKGEISAITHEFLNLREFINKQLDFNPFNRFQKHHPEGSNDSSKEGSRENNRPLTEEKT